MNELVAATKHEKLILRALHFCVCRCIGIPDQPETDPLTFKQDMSQRKQILDEIKEALNE